MSDLFSPVPDRFLKMILEYCDKSVEPETIFCGTYLKRWAELGLFDLDGFCDKLNYVFFAGRGVLDPGLFGEYNVGEIIGVIKEKSALGGVLN